MNIADTLVQHFTDLIPTGATLAAVLIVVLAVRWVLNRRYGETRSRQFRVQMTMLLVSFVGLIAVILALPVSESTLGQLLSLIGLLLSAAIALSATTFVGNIMAGLMLRAVKNFRAGDFVIAGDHFGRVSERGLFHIEIQTENRDLTTLPNLFLITNPVKVVRASGTLVAAEVSLGYDIPCHDAESALLKAAESAGLEDGFVHVMNLSDFSVTYRVAGLLSDVKTLLSTRSRLRKKMLDCLHAASIEIVSPTFMNQRALQENRRFIPENAVGTVVPDPTPNDLPETVLFDKADEAESLDKLQQRRELLIEEIKRLKKSVDESESDDARAALKLQIEETETRLQRLEAYITKREEKSQGD